MEPQAEIILGKPDRLEPHEGGLEGRLTIARVTDLAALTRSGEGTPIWTCETEDLNLNLVVLPVNGEIAEHRNAEVDVLLVGVEGTGSVTVEGEEHELGPGRIIVVPKGASRSIGSRRGQFAYLTCHRRRGRLWPAALPSR